MDFFHAINEGDFDIMRALWLKSNDTTCGFGKPDKSIITGYNNIMGYWSSSLQQSKTDSSTMIKPRNVKMIYQGDIAVVTCVEEVVSKRVTANTSGIKKYRYHHHHHHRDYYHHHHHCREGYC